MYVNIFATALNFAQLHLTCRQ